VGLDRALLVGHSLGGAIALRTALDYPEHVAGLALIAPLTRPLREVAPEFAVLNIERPWLRRLAAETIALLRAERDALRTLAFVFGPQEPPEDFAVEGGALCSMRPSHFFASSTDLVAAHRGQDDMTNRYAEITVPVGIIFGDADRVLHHDEHGASMVGRIADLEIEILEGVGHMVQYADTRRTVDFIRRVAERAFAA
jgi:pimeloyl-ACP methyl ester carboxylesterase